MILLNQPVIGEEEITNVCSALRETYISGLVGKFKQEFEERFSAYCGVRYGISTTSGTTALHLALAVLGIGPGDEVIIPTLTNIATAFAVVYCGATPVVVDSESETFNMDVSQIESKITPKTKAIMPVHLYGHPVDMDPLLEIAHRYGLYVVEDAAEAHGAQYRGRRVGCLGDIGCFSFLANKIITTGEGGMVVTDNPEFAKKANSLKNLAFSSERKFLHHEIGFNYRLTNIQAAIGVAQLDRIDKVLIRKREIAEFYNQRFQNIEGLVLPVEKEWAYHVYWVYGFLVEEDKFGRSRDDVVSVFKERGIEPRTSFIPMHQQPVFHKMGILKDANCPVAEEVSRKGLYLSAGWGMMDEELEYIANTLLQLRR